MKDSRFKITGGAALKGGVEISGAKNSVLPLLFSAILAEGRHELRNAPDLADVDTALTLLRAIGLQVKKEKSAICVHNSMPEPPASLPEGPAQEMRASILCLGPLLARFGRAALPLPGGCVIGARPIDLHLKGLRAMGSSIEIKKNMIFAKAAKGLKAAKIRFPAPSVGGTENLLMAAVLAKGKTIIQNAAIEPEIFDLMGYLRSMGAKISQTGARELSIEGRKLLEPSAPYTVMPDRIEAGTWLLAAAVTGGEVLAKNCRPQHLAALLEKLRACGFFYEAGKDSALLRSPAAGGAGSLKAAHIATAPFPGFPTDLQPQFAALMTRLPGESALKETVFEGRFRHLEGLKKMGAAAGVKVWGKTGQTVWIKGPSALKGACVQAGDLRGGAGLILAALAAEGCSFVSGARYLDRGYENLVPKLRSLGASIERLPLPAESSVQEAAPAMS